MSGIHKGFLPVVTALATIPVLFNLDFNFYQAIFSLPILGHLPNLVGAVGETVPVRVLTGIDICVVWMSDVLHGADKKVLLQVSALKVVKMGVT